MKLYKHAGSKVTLDEVSNKSPDEKMDDAWISAGILGRHEPPMQSCPQVYGDIHRYDLPTRRKRINSWRTND
jgi:hypothetical protein